MWNGTKLLVAGGAALFVAGQALAAPIILDDFEGSEGHFAVQPTFSGSTTGITTGSTADLDPSMGHTGTSSQLLTLIPSSPPNAIAVRHLSGVGSAGNNVALGNTGYVGYFLKTTDSGLTTRIGIDDSADSTERSNSVAIIDDGQWHLYQWDLGDSANWNAWVGSSNGAINGSGTIDAIWIDGASVGATVEISLDTVAHNPQGNLDSLIPEPASLALLGLGGLMMLRRRQK